MGVRVWRRIAGRRVLEGRRARTRHVRRLGEQPVQHAYATRARNAIRGIVAQEFSSVGNIQTAYYAMPRNYYLTARYNF